MQVLFYRDCRTINKYEFATVTAEGVKIEGPIALDSNWEVAHYVRLDQLTVVVYQYQIGKLTVIESILVVDVSVTISNLRSILLCSFLWWRD